MFHYTCIQIWFYDGSVQCYRGWHILLAIVALVSLLLLGLIIPLIAAALYFKYVRRKASKKTLSLVLYTHPTALHLPSACPQPRFPNPITANSYPSQLHLSLVAKLEPFSFALAKGFKEKYQWWPIMDMACRYLFVIIVVSAVGKKVSIILIMTASY